MLATLTTSDLGPIVVDDFPARANPRDLCPPPARRTSGIQLDAGEEAAARFGDTPANDHNDSTCTNTTNTTNTKDTPMSAMTKTRRPALMTPKSRTRRAWLAYREAEQTWRTACLRYESETRGYPGPDKRTARQDKLMEAWESVIDELCAQAVSARNAMKRAIADQRRAEVLDLVRASA